MTADELFEKLDSSAKTVSHFQKVVLRIGDYLIYLSLGLVALLIIVQIFRHAPLLDLVQFALILFVASIPVAMPAVLSVFCHCLIIRARILPAPLRMPRDMVSM